MMDLELRGHAAIVQGASAGIGLGIARALAQEGVDVLLVARTPDKLRAAADELRALGTARVDWRAMDSADVDHQHHLVEHIMERYGRLDIVVANSGGPKPGAFNALLPEDWRAAAELLVVGPVALLQAALPRLRESPAPRFLIVTSISTRQPVEGLTLSNVFRPGIVGLVKTLASELGNSGLRIHSLAPGLTETARLDGLMAKRAAARGVDEATVRADAIAGIPAGRLGRATDIGALAAFLASPLADYLTGQNWLVDGGMVKSL